MSVQYEDGTPIPDVERAKNKLCENNKSIPDVEKSDVEKSKDSLHIIESKDPLLFEAIVSMIKFIGDTYSDKYQSDIVNIINTKHILTDTPGGKFANFQNAAKYLQRYYTEGFSKSYNVQDLYKSIHYIVFEITRRLKEEKNGKK